ncbi:recombinase family protein [Chryseolinea sp. T2]|uniref:recombinase family protein n=1 Tax=Chryseolinea sp. T2 TaxID=3129255 RepID=UPI0030773D1D
MKFVAYYRVSTHRQGASGLGLDAQRQTVQDFIKGDKRHVLESSYKEVETGKNNARAELMKALSHCKKSGATLLIAKLDRLSRNVAFIFTLRDSGVPFRALDVPDANTLTIGIFATVAQHEREIISARIKDALAAKKRRGFKLGTPANLTAKAIKRGMQVRIENARSNENNQKANTLIQSLRKQGISFAAIASELNANNFTTSRGNQFYAGSVERLFKQFRRYRPVR